MWMHIPAAFDRWRGVQVGGAGHRGPGQPLPARAHTHARKLLLPPSPAGGRGGPEEEEGDEAGVGMSSGVEEEVAEEEGEAAGASESSDIIA